MDTLLGSSDVVFGYAPAPNTRRYASGGLPAQDYAGGGLPAPVYGSEPAGDAGEGTDLLLSYLGIEQKGRYEPEDAGLPINHDSGFTPVPGVLPGEKHLNYARTFTITTLLTIGIILLLVKAVRDPTGAARLVGQGAQRHAGVK